MKILSWIFIFGITTFCTAQQTWIKSSHNPITLDVHQQAGSHEIRWSGQSRQNLDVTSGVYILRVKTDTYQQSRRIILIR
ncbi:hypothetical protein HQ585_02010 [candidate division KSB1 bacterium]|nr:hypothetical protein [candidate division KSB1 bacterium]